MNEKTFPYQGMYMCEVVYEVAVGEDVIMLERSVGKNAMNISVGRNIEIIFPGSLYQSKCTIKL